MRIRLILTLLLAGAVSAPAASLNGLYFGLDNMRGFAEVYWWFQPDGRVLRNTLPTSLTTAGFNAACQSNSGFCSTYTLNGAKLAIQNKDGKTEDWTYAVLNGGIQLNYLILTPVDKFAAGARLSGTFDRSSSTVIHSAPGSNTTITAPTFYTFKPDGTFTMLSMVGVDRELGVKGASGTSSQQSQKTGTYNLHDNVLELTSNGGKEQHMVFPVAGGSLNIDGVVYKKQAAK